MVAQDDDQPVVVIDLRKPFDQRLMEFAVETLADTPAHLFMLQIDAHGIASGDPAALVAAIDDAPAPVVVWIGERARPSHCGGVAEPAQPGRHGRGRARDAGGISRPRRDERSSRLAPPNDRFPGETEEERRQMRSRHHDPHVEIALIDEPIPGYVDHVVPWIGQLIVGLDGEVITRRGDARSRSRLPRWL